jgi:hypothetical protein
MTIDPGAGTATLPPILGAMIAFDLHIGTNGVLVINPDDPPAGPMTATTSAGATSAALSGSGLLLTASQPGSAQSTSSATVSPSSGTNPAMMPTVAPPSYTGGTSGSSTLAWNVFGHVAPPNDGSEFDIFAGNVL